MQYIPILIVVARRTGSDNLKVVSPVVFSRSACKQ